MLTALVTVVPCRVVNRYEYSQAAPDFSGPFLASYSAST